MQGPSIRFGTRAAPDGKTDFYWQHPVLAEFSMPPKDLMRILKKAFPKEWQEVHLEIVQANGSSGLIL